MVHEVRRKQHSIRSIIEYWQEHSDEFPNLWAHTDGWEEPFCFACGWMPPFESNRALRMRKAQPWLDKAHLEDWAHAHNDTVDNMVLLCHLCHISMPSFQERKKAIRWVDEHPRTEWLWQSWTDAQISHRKYPPKRNTTIVRYRMRFLEMVNDIRARAEQENPGDLLPTKMLFAPIG